MSNVTIRLMRSMVGAEESAAVARVIEEGYLGMGSEVQAFERELATFLGDRREVVLVNTCTAALHLALQACDIGPGDEVLCPTFTFVATFQAISASGATPIPCDVRADNAWLDVADAAARVTPRTKAIMPVHYAGAAGNLDAVYALARKLRLRVIEDAAPAFGSRYRGELIGARGDIVCLSFDGVKNITSGEGGAVVTSDARVAERVRDARLLAVEKDTEKRYANDRSWEFDVVEQGWRFHMSNLLAAVGRVQLRRFEQEFKPRRVEIARRYVRLLAKTPTIRTLNHDYGEVVPWSFPVFIGNGARDHVRQALAAEGIETGIGYKPNHLLTRYGGGAIELPVAEQLYREVLTLPLHPMLTNREQDAVVDAVLRALDAAPGQRESTKRNSADECDGGTNPGNGRRAPDAAGARRRATKP
jgi:dTDP-4-amino-4,6-dideoxygalactose transaminase